MGHLRALFAASFHICCLLTVIATAQDQTLQVGTPLERQLRGGQTHTFTVTLDENTFIQFVVEQRGVDVVVNVSGPDLKSLGRTDTPNGPEGPEIVSFVATTAGAYRITVTPLNQDAHEGPYAIKIIELREATEQELKSSKNLEGIKEKGIALLGEAENLISELRTPQTRIRSQILAAQMLREVDEKRAAKFLNDAAAGFTELLTTIDLGDPNYMMDHNGIMQLRQEILQNLAARDPDAALSFLQASKLPGSPYGNKREQEMQESALELTIADQIVAKDPKRAYEIARQKLKSGYSLNLVNTLATIQQKNPELAIELGNEIVRKLLSEKLLKKPEAATLSIALIHTCRQRDKIAHGFAERVAVGQDRLISEESCRDLLQKAFEDATSFSPPAANVHTPDREAAWNLLSGLQQLGQELNQTVTGGQASIEKKLREMNFVVNAYQSMVVQEPIVVQTNGPVEEVTQNIENAPEDIREHLYVQLANSAAARGDGAAARKIISEHVSNPFQRRHALASLEQQEMFQAMSRGKVEDALKAIGELKSPRERASMLGQIARQIGPGYKRAAALSLLEQARSMVAPGMQAQDQEQLNALLELARAFARYDAKRAFDIIDPLIDQFNELCTAARTLQGFGLEFFRNDELEMLNGNNLTGMSISFASVLGALALTNFERAKTSADRLRLPEVRLRAYLDIAQETIGATKPTNEMNSSPIIHPTPGI